MTGISTFSSESISLSDKNDNFSAPKKSDKLQLQNVEKSIQNSKILRVLEVLENDWDLSKKDKEIYKGILGDKSISFLNELSDKPKNEILQFLIQTQIDGLTKKGLGNLTDDEFEEYIKLSDNLIAVKRVKTTQNDNLITAKNTEIKAENNKQEHQKTTITAKNTEINAEKAETTQNDNTITAKNTEIKAENNKQARLSKVESRLSSIEGALFIMKDSSNPHINKIVSLVQGAQKLNIWDETTELDIGKMENSLKQIIAILHKPLALPSIAKDLQEYDKKNGTNNYESFKTTVIAIDPTLRGAFDPVDQNIISDIAKMKLWTTHLNGVNINGNPLKIEDWGMMIEASRDGRNIFVDSNYKLSSPLNTQNEEDLQAINAETTTKLSPVNEKLNSLTYIFDFVQKSKSEWKDFSEIKETLEKDNPDIYKELLLDNKNSFDEVLSTIDKKKKDLENKKKTIIKNANIGIKELINENIKEAKERDKNKKAVLRFFNSIGFDKLSQTETNIVIETVNISPWAYWLDWPIDLENWSIGFNRDGWDSDISSKEQSLFIRFFNKMLWENIVKINDTNQKIIPLTTENISKIQKLKNKKAWYFLWELTTNTKIEVAETLNSLTDILKIAENPEDTDFIKMKKDIKEKQKYIYEELWLEKIESFDEIVSVINDKRKNLKNQEKQLPLFDVLISVQEWKNREVEFSEIKNTLKKDNLDTYNELWFENMNSLDEIVSVINNKIEG